MPILKRRYPYMKLYRPSGTLYANGRTWATVGLAVIDAEAAFFTEFKRLPKQAITTIEVIGVTGGWAATILEIHE